MEFPFSVGVCQGSARSPLLFFVIKDAITGDLQESAPKTLLYDDDVLLASRDNAELERQMQSWCDCLIVFGLKLNVKKTEYLTTDVNESGCIKVCGTELARTSVFKYLGSGIGSDGSFMVERTPSCSKWRSLTGVLYDRRVPEQLKSNIYRSVVRPVAMYGACTMWPISPATKT
ncbi:unnamed protein product [Heligmosomoides polygyrus]|uniref:Reverse transcriptase domain-containing protein n=1 Tax=Heligmosomoides polygyrus TaxID=6339 RepID=A0A183GL95_HELPZ|nr:unnamed protein product [Heligmosomoides polygyrus]